MIPTALTFLRTASRLSPSTFTSLGRDDDPRMCRLYTDSYADASVVLLGFPHDTGCARNGGRPGAAEGPKAFRRFAPVLGPTTNPELNISLVSPSSPLYIYDAGDAIAEDGQLETAHQLLENSVLAVLESGKIPFIIGGGNDQSAPNGRAALTYLAAQHAKRAAEGSVMHQKSAKTFLGVINIDAHLDVRPRIDGKVHSGTPFRELLEDPRFNGSRFVEFACQGQQCSQEHADYVQAQGGALRWFTHISNTAPRLNPETRRDEVVIAVDSNPHMNRLSWFEHELNRISKEGEATFVSFDIDAVQGSECPGVSCPGNVGLTSEDALLIARAAGKSKHVRLMDLSELNPVVEDYRSPRLAVMIFYHFLLGLAERN